MGIAFLATRQEVVKVKAVDDTSALQKYVIALPECDNVTDANRRPSVNACVIEPEVDILLILIVESYFRQDSGTKSEMRPFKSTLNFEYGGLNIVLLHQVNIGSKNTKKKEKTYFLPCINDNMALHFLNVCDTLRISCPPLFLQSLLTCIMLSENSGHLRCMSWICKKIGGG